MSRTILIVDDSVTDRVMLSGFLKSEYNILEASGGKEAIEILGKNFKAVSAIVMDVVMPDMDGFQTLKTIKTNAVWLNIPVILATGLNDDESREKAIAYGADNFVTKPFNQTLLKHIVKNAIRLRETAAIANTLWRDSLTGLLNRESFFTEAERMIRRRPAGFYVLSCLDVDNFKVINDQYGAEAGDNVIKHIAACLNGFVAGINGLASRYMADKFAILFPASMRGSQLVRENLDKAMSPSCLSRPIRIRVGSYHVNDITLSVNSMFDRASMAEASVKGRYDSFMAEYTESMREELLNEQQIVNSMVEALQNGQFEPWFQPQYNHASGALIGSEALVRWHRDGKIIPPSSFIPIFEKNGFIYEVDQYVWRQVCIILRRWLDEDRSPLPVSVNISRYDLFQKDFLDIISGLVTQYDLPVGLLRLEITESAFSDSTNTITGIVNQLIERGFTVEIDDFGSGYSSLNTLKDVPASILKLDMRFFETTENSQRGGNIVESMVRMAKWLGMAVIAEGVEDKAQADYLKTIGCFYIQGYYYAKPMPVNEYEALFTSGKKEMKLSRLQTLKTLDNNQFWDPKSMDTLIFNSYVGAACILEYSRDKLEMLRATDYFVTMLGSTTMTIKDALGINWRNHLDNKGLCQFSDAVMESMETKEVVYGEYEFLDLPGCPPKTIVRAAIRVIATAGERCLVYCLDENITAQRTAERERLESAEQLEIIMGNINGSVSAILMDDIGNTTLIFGNDKYYEIFGYTKEQADEIQLDTMSCIIPEDYDMVVEKLNQLKKDGVPVNIDYRAQKRDGSIIYIRSNSSRMSMEGYGDQVIVSVETDITEKRTLEDQLRAIVDNINGGVSATFLRGDAPEFVIVNDKYFEIIGYTREQFAVEVANVFEIIHPDDRERVKRLFTEAEKDEKAYTMEYRILRRNGAVRHILCNTNVMRLFGVDEPVQLAVSNDITVLRQVQQKESELTNQLQTIMANINGGITATVFHDKDDVEIIFANDGFYELYGYTKEQLAAELPNMLDLIVPDDREKTMATVERIVNERGSETYEYRCRRRDGSIMWNQVTNAVISMEGVGDTVLLAIVTDITELRLAERQSAAAIDRLRAVMNSMNNGMTAVAFHGSHTDFLFANDKFFEMHGISRQTYEHENLSESLALVYPDDREKLRNVIWQASKTGLHSEVEYRIQRPDGTIRLTKASINVTNLSGVDVPVQVTIYADITAEREAVEQLRFLNSTAHDILIQPNTEVAIDNTLHNIIDYFAADRTYVVELDHDKMLSSNTYEVCADGIESEMDNLHGLPFTERDYWFSTLSSDRFLIIEDVSKLKDDEEEVRQLLTKQGITSIVLAPLWHDGQLSGFVGCDNPYNAVNQIERLTALADYISILLTRRDLKRKIEHDSRVVQQLMNDTPGGFLRMAICEKTHPAIVSFNEGFGRMLAMTGDEVMAAYGDDAFKCLTTEDIEASAEEYNEALAGCGQFTIKCRLPKKDGSRLWVMVFGRFVRDEGGRLLLNCYFTDITRQKQFEEQQIQLLDNLPNGAALYEYNGTDLTVVHINKGYWRLVERDKVDYGKASVFGAIHPGDRTLIRQEIDSAIRQKRNADADVRLLCGGGSYRPFHISANITENGGGKYLLYVSYTPISDETMSIQEMLPIALSTMIATTDDISYVKDKDLRYICCSQSIADMTAFANPRDLIGKTALDVFDRKYAEKFNEDDSGIIRTGEPMVNMIEHIPTTDGGIRLVRTSKFPILNASGIAIGVYCVSHDVTAQKEKESQLELLTNTIPGGLAAYSISKDGFTTLYFNDGYYRYSGYTRDEYVAMTENEPLALMFEEDRGQLLDMVHDFAIKKIDGMTGSCTYRCRTKDGGCRWMSLKAVLSQVGEDAYILNVVQLDVTDSMEVESRRTQLLDNLPFGAALFEFDGQRISPIHINKQYIKMVNREVDYSLEGFEPVKFIHPDDRQVVLDEINDAIKTQRNACCEVRLLYGDGEYRSFRLDAKITPKGDGNYLLYVAYTRISQQETTFKSLLPYMFSTIMEASTNLAFAKDVNFRYICCSKTFARLLGLKSEKDVVGKTDYELFSKEIADIFRRDDSELFANGKPQVDILEAIPSPDGTQHYTRTTKHLLRSITGDIMGVYCVGRDVTEIREAYAQLKLLTDTIPGGIATFHCSKDGMTLTYFNDGYCGLFGYTRQQYLEHYKVPLDSVFPEDRPILDEQLEKLISDQTPIDCVFRVHIKDGGYKWVNCQATAVERIRDALVTNVVLTDITDQQEEKERLRLAEEEYRLATVHSNRTICRYNIAAQTLAIAEATASRLKLPMVMTDVPYGRVKLGKISKDTEKAYIAFYESIMHGQKECSVTFQKDLNSEWRWIEARSTTIFDADGNPASAIISYSDVTELREKEAVYIKWQNSLASRPENSYTLFRCNLSRSASFDSWDGKLLDLKFDNSVKTFDQRTDEFVEQCVYAEDRESYRAFLLADTMLAEYYRGHRSDSIDFRECTANGTIRWLRLTVELVEYPDSTDVEAYLMYENIDSRKRTELKTIHQAETDPLTGVLNRATFAARMNRIISASKSETRHALLMLDIDGFKLINDVFGHGAGDQALTDVADILSKISRRGDLVGRLGGDEFLVFMADIPGEGYAANKARQICQLTRKSFSTDVQISSSVGIAMYPQDGESFAALYKVADATLYRVKGSGKNSFAFSHDGIDEDSDGYTTEKTAPKIDKKVRRMLIVDDSPVENAMLGGLFKDDYRIEKAMDGASALAKLRHYGSSISVVILDLMMPGMDGFEVLHIMQQDVTTRSIPVIVASVEGDRETALRVIKAGAADFVTKPIDIDLLRLRVESAVSKAENERLRAQNSYLSLRDSEVSNYKSALERSGILVITLDWIKSEFTYSPLVAKRLAGKYDGRNFWQALLLDMVTDSVTVQKMQQLVHDIADRREQTEGSMTVRLKTSVGLSRMFEMNVFKEVNSYQLAEKMIITLKETAPAQK